MAYAANETAVPTPFTLGGKTCIGADQLDGCGFSPSVRVWFNDQIALEALINEYNGHGAIGLGFIQNIAHPQRDVYIHLLGRATFANFTSTPQLVTPVFTLTYFSFTAGIGFEVFMPFCENLSVDGWMGEEFYAEDYDGTYSGFTTMLNSIGSPINLAIHAYF
jgi:hypothetical protein